MIRMKKKDISKYNSGRMKVTRGTSTSSCWLCQNRSSYQVHQGMVDFPASLWMANGAGAMVHEQNGCTASKMMKEREWESAPEQLFSLWSSGGRGLVDGSFSWLHTPRWQSTAHILCEFSGSKEGKCVEMFARGYRSKIFAASSSYVPSLLHPLPSSSSGLCYWAYATIRVCNINNITSNTSGSIQVRAHHQHTSSFILWKKIQGRSDTVRFKYTIRY